MTLDNADVEPDENVLDFETRFRQQRLAKLPFTEAGLGDRVLLLREGEFYFVPGKGFAVWSMTRWKWDLTSREMRRVVKTAIRELRIESVKAETDNMTPAEKKAQTDLWAYLSKGDSLTFVNNAIKWPESEPKAVAPLTMFDSNPYLFNCANGTLDLTTGELREFRREDYLTKGSTVTFNPAAKCPKWDKFMFEIFAGNEEHIAAMHRWLGYCLTGDNTEQRFMIINGAGGNGKTTILVTIEFIMGDEYADEIDSAILMTRSAVSDYNVKATLAGYVGHRLLTTTEMKGGGSLEASLLKNITGGEKVSAGYKHKQPFNYVPTFKITIGVNRLPNVGEHTDALWRRVITVPMTVRIS